MGVGDGRGSPTTRGSSSSFASTQRLDQSFAMPAIDGEGARSREKDSGSGVSILIRYTKNV